MSLLDWVNGYLDKRELQRRDNTKLLVSRPGHMPLVEKITALPSYIPPGSVLVLNSSGVFASLYFDGKIRGGIQFAYMLNGNATQWAIRCSHTFSAGHEIALPDGATLSIIGNYHVATGPTVGYQKAQFVWPGGPFSDYWPAQLAQAKYNGEPVKQRPTAFYANCFSGTHRSAVTDGGGHNLTPPILQALHENGVHFAFIEVATGPGWPHLPDRAVLQPDDAAVINLALAEGRLVIPVGASVLRAVTHLRERDGRIRADDTWCDSLAVWTRPSPWQAFMSALPGDESQRSALASVSGSGKADHELAAVSKNRLRLGVFGDTWLYLPE